MRFVLHMLVACLASGAVAGCEGGGTSSRAAAAATAALTGTARARVVDAAGAPVSGAVVIAESATTGEAQEGDGLQATGSDGLRELALAPGRWTLVAVGAGGASPRVDVDVAPGATAEATLTVRETDLEALVEDFVRQGPQALGLEEGE